MRRVGCVCCRWCCWLRGREGGAVGMGGRRRIGEGGAGSWALAGLTRMASVG
jgi:hypothetical protein